MRITTGSLKGRRLKSPGNLKVRPPLDQLKQSVFNMLAGEMEERKVLDLFAGSGSFGLEALSRGAQSAIFIDSSFKACRLLKENIQILRLEDKATVMCRKVNEALESFAQEGRCFDLVFVDPPFPANLCQKTLDKLFEQSLLNHNAIIVFHHQQKEEVCPSWGNLELARKRKFGDNLVSIFLYTRQEKS